MIGFVTRRALSGILTLFVFVTVVFFAVSTLIPHDFASQFAVGGPGVVREVQAELGLDRPLVVQYLDFLGTVARGSLGTSFTGTPVRSVLLSNLPMTLLVFAVGGVLAFMLGSWLGRVVNWGRGRLLRPEANGAAVLLYTAFPPFLIFLLVRFLTEPMFEARELLGLPPDSLHVWRESDASQEGVLVAMTVSLLAALAIALVTSVLLRRRGRRSLGPLPLLGALAAAVVAWHFFGVGREAMDLLFRGRPGVFVGAGSPALAVLGFLLLAFGEIAFVVGAGMQRESDEGYVLTARAKGLPGWMVRDRHVARNAQLAATVRSVTAIPYLLTGLIIIEAELELEGISGVFFQSVRNVDLPLLMGTLIVMGLLTLGLRLTLEVLQVGMDPRLRSAEAGR